MSNIYIQEPPTNGKVVLSTSIGDIEVELWSKEAPLACRNFVQLCMENYYNNTIFHRVIPGFIAQGGDPEGTGEGGESIYGKPFKDEFHSRLRFVRRGLVGMANSGPDDNGAQFFFTLGPTKELQNKNTIFGKVTGDTLYNLPRFEEGEIDKHDRPAYPHKITKTEVLINPFTDIVPREKIQNEISKEERKSKKKKKGIKNFSLLSFGGEAEEEEETVISANKELGGGGGSEPSLVDVANVEEEQKEKDKAKERIKDKLRLLASGSKETEGEKAEDNSSSQKHKSHKKEKGESKRKREEISDEKQKKKHRSESKESANENNEPVTNVEKDSEREESEGRSVKNRKEVRDEIKQLQRELYGKSKILNEVKEPETTEEKADKKSSAVQDFLVEKQKYISDNSKVLNKKTKKKESFSLSILEKFKSKVRKAIEEDEEEEENKQEEDWLTHKIVFEDSAPVLAKDASSKDDSWYALDDPRHPLNKQRREESGKKKSKKRHR